MQKPVIADELKEKLIIAHNTIKNNNNDNKDNIYRFLLLFFGFLCLHRVCLFCFLCLVLYCVFVSLPP